MSKIESSFPSIALISDLVRAERARLEGVRSRLTVLLNDLPPRWHGAIQRERTYMRVNLKGWGHIEAGVFQFYQAFSLMREKMNYRGLKYDGNIFDTSMPVIALGIVVRSGFFRREILPLFEAMYEDAQKQEAHTRDGIGKN